MDIDQYRVDDSDKEVVAIAEVVSAAYLNHELRDYGIYDNGTKVMLVEDGGAYRMYGFDCTVSGRVGRNLGPAYKLIRWVQ